jgi:hypothetical protein
MTIGLILMTLGLWIQTICQYLRPTKVEWEIISSSFLGVYFFGYFLGMGASYLAWLGEILPSHGIAVC